MTPKQRYLKPLLFEINSASTYTTKNAFATTTMSELPFCNRAGNLSKIASGDIEAIAAYFGNLPFRWFIEDTDINGCTLLESCGYASAIAFPAMHRSLEHVESAVYPDIEIKKVANDDDLQLWLEVACASYKIPVDAFSKFITYQIEVSTPNKLHFYIAFYKGMPAAVSMTIQDETTSALHWVGTRPEFRNKGCGYAVSHYPLLDAKSMECTDAVLFASTMGEPVYKKLGYTTYAIYKTYGKNLS